MNKVILEMYKHTIFTKNTKKSALMERVFCISSDIKDNIKEQLEMHERIEELYKYMSKPHIKIINE